MVGLEGCDWDQGSTVPQELHFWVQVIPAITFTVPGAPWEGTGCSLSCPRAAVLSEPGCGQVMALTFGLCS